MKQRQSRVITVHLVNIQAPGTHGSALGAAQGGPFAGRGSCGHMTPGAVLPPLLARGRGRGALCSVSEALHPGTVGILKWQAVVRKCSPSEASRSFRVPQALSLKSQIATKLQPFSCPSGRCCSQTSHAMHPAIALTRPARRRGNLTAWREERRCCKALRVEQMLEVLSDSLKGPA